MIFQFNEKERAIMKRRVTIYLVLLLGIAILDIVYLKISAGEIGLDLLQMLLINIMLICQILRDVFSKKRESLLPEELQAQEDYVLAKNRVSIGGKMGIAGGAMIILPIILLLSMKELHGAWARLAVFSFLGGVPVALFGVAFAVMGSGYITKAEAKYRAEHGVGTEPDCKISTICNILSVIGSVALLVVIFID